MFSFLDNYNSCRDKLEQFFSSSSTTTKNRLICVNYLPLMRWVRNTPVYGMLSMPSGATFEVAFRRSPSSSSDTVSPLRSSLLRIQTLQEECALAVTTSAGFSQLNEHLQQMQILLMDLCSVCDDLKVLTNTVVDISEKLDSYVSGGLEMSLEVLSDQKSAIREWLDQALQLPDTLADLLAYIETRCSSPVKVIRGIEELSAINLITEDFRILEENASANLLSESEWQQYDQYMLHANYELLSLFTSKFSRPGCSVMIQDTYKRLSEFVPIAMKFWHIYNPLLDARPNSNNCWWDYLADRFSIVGTAECITNSCGLNGTRMDVPDTEYDSHDPDTQQVGHIYYGMCCDIDAVFKGNATVTTEAQLFAYRIVPGADVWLPNAIKYSPYLAEAMIIQMLKTAMELGRMMGDTTCSYDEKLAPVFNGSFLRDSGEGDMGELCDLTQCHRLLCEGDVLHLSLSYTELALAEAVLTALPSSKLVSYSRLNIARKYLETSLSGANLQLIGQQWV